MFGKLKSKKLFFNILQFASFTHAGPTLWAANRKYRYFLARIYKYLRQYKLKAPERPKILHASNGEFYWSKFNSENDDDYEFFEIRYRKARNPTQVMLGRVLGGNAFDRKCLGYIGNFDKSKNKRLKQNYW